MGNRERVRLRVDCYGHNGFRCPHAALSATEWDFDDPPLSPWARSSELRQPEGGRIWASTLPHRARRPRRTTADTFLWVGRQPGWKTRRAIDVGRSMMV